MSPESSRCPKCQSSMVEGFLLDVGDKGGRRAAEWVEGVPERSFWMGLKIKGRERRTVVSFCCSRCGFIELYAKETPQPPQ